MKHPDPLFIGIAGGSGSGKTTVARERFRARADTAALRHAALGCAR